MNNLEKVRKDVLCSYNIINDCKSLIEAKTYLRVYINYLHLEHEDRIKYEKLNKQLHDIEQNLKYNLFPIEFVGEGNEDKELIIVDEERCLDGLLKNLIDLS